jgi:sugar-specific transcriptional regulator TrmB
MATDAEFISRLIGFGLSEKEALTYLHLLKYGPKSPSPLAKSLKTYREDVHRTLTSLIEKGMVRPSLDAPTVYTAVELETALESALKKHEAELHEMEARKIELEELSRQHRFSPSDQVSTFKIMKGLKELLATVATIILSLKEEFFVVCTENTVMVTSLFGINPLTKAFIEQGGRARVLVTDFSYKGIPATQELIDIGVDVRYLGEETAIFVVFDKKTCITGLHWELTSVSLDQPLTSLFTDDASYAQYLTSTFEMMWKQSTPVEERIRELLKQGPPQA